MSTLIINKQKDSLPGIYKNEKGGLAWTFQGDWTEGDKEAVESLFKEIQSFRCSEPKLLSLCFDLDNYWIFSQNGNNSIMAWQNQWKYIRFIGQMKRVFGQIIKHYQAYNKSDRRAITPDYIKKNLGGKDLRRTKE